MSYQVIKRKFGTNKQEVLWEINVSGDISDFCFIPDFGCLLVFKDKHSIAHVDMEGNIDLSWIGTYGEQGNKDGTGRHARLSYPSSICYQSNLKKVFVVEDGGTNIRYIDIKSPYLSSLLGKAVIESLTRYTLHVDIPSINTFCCVNKYGQLFWTADKLHRCFKYYKGSANVVVGTGRCGYSTSSDVIHSKLNHPSGITMVGNKVYIADKGNHCIREISKGGICIFEGTPLNTNDMSNPSFLKNYKNIFYILDDNGVRYFSPSGPSKGVIHSGDKVEGVALDGKDLLILEETNAKT